MRLSRLKNNLIIHYIYRFKFYIDITISQISWITGKLPELMALVYLTEKFGLTLTLYQVILICILSLLSLFGLGLLIHRLGIYEVEQYTNAKRNPVTNEMLSAARKINRKL